ncbi:MAG: branched-chain amino acid ABC transporter permease [Candidatus Methylomirabilia bacterium]
MQWFLDLFPWITNGPFVLVQLLSGIATGMLLFILAVGLSLIFGVTRIINFAHGSFYMVGAFLSYTVIVTWVKSSNGFWLALVLVPLGVAALGALIEITLLRKIYRSEEVFQLLLTFGLVLILGDFVKLVWGAENRMVHRPELLAGSYNVMGQPFPTYSLMVLGLGPLLALFLWFVFYRTRWGVLIRAATEDREMVGALGINQAWLYTSVFAFGSWLAGLAGVLAAPLSNIAPGMDFFIIIQTFVVVVVGGLGSFPGSILSALIIGVLSSFGILIFPSISMVLIFLIMAVVLIFRPWGLLGQPEA